MSTLAADPITIHDSFGRVHRVIPGTTQLTESIPVTVHISDVHGTHPEVLQRLLAMRAGFPLMAGVEHEMDGDVIDGRMTLNVIGDVREYLKA